jgi:putative transposase
LIEREKAHHPVATLCRVLGVSTSGYYAWRDRPPSARAQANAALQERVETIHQASRQTYGVLRIQAELRAEGIRCGTHRLGRLMRLAGIEGCHRRKRHGTTQREESHPVAPDLVSRDFRAGAPNEIWVADITYVPTWDGFLYLSVVLDAYSRKVVGWCMADHLRTELVLSALEMAVLTRHPDPGVIHHSDQGCQYTSIAFGYRCREAGIAPSMGSRGDCFDNAMAESFFATLECELLNRQRFKTKNDARMAIFDYIETFYNRERRHSALGYLAPVAYEQQRNQVAA